MKKVFTKKELEDMDLPYSAIVDKIVDTTRWSEIHEIVFKYDGKFYRTGYSCGATECQDERPWEYENEITATQVEKRKVEVEKWMPVED